MFMNPTLLKIVTSLKDCKTDLQSRSTKAGKSAENDLRNFAEHLNTAQKESIPETNLPSVPGSSIGKKRPGFDIDSFKKALLAKGKPLNKAFLKNEDLPLLKKFLFKCGFSQEKVDRLFKDLLENNPKGEINLSRFFRKLTELGPPKSKNQDSVLLEPAAVPYLESILRGFGLTPRDLDSVFSAARTEDGRLDPAKIVAKLNRIADRQNKKISLTAVQKLDHQLADKLKMLGVDIPQQGQNGWLSLKDFISSLEQMAGKPYAQDHLPSEVKTTMENLLAKVIVPDEKTGTTISKTLVPESKAAVNDVLLAPFRGKGTAADKKNLLSATKRAGSAQKNEKLSAVANKSGSLNTNSEQQKAPPADQTEKFATLARLDGGRGLKQEVKKENHVFKAETKAVNMTQPVTGSTAFEAVHAVKHNDKPNNFMPAYLVDQVGRQISKAILKGDRIIKLNLKPPELGAVKIEMAIKDNTLNLEIFTANNIAKELLLANVHELREALLGQDVKLEKMDVQINYDFNQSLANSEEGLRERQRLIKEQGRGPLAEEITVDDPLSGPSTIVAGNRLLSLVA